MFKRKKKKSTHEKEFDFDLENEINDQLDSDNFYDEDEDEDYDYSDEIFDIELNETIKNNDNDNQIKTKDFYVKKEDIIAEIKKYNDSKLSSPDGQGIISEELRYNGHENLYSFFNASTFLSVIVIEMNLSQMLLHVV